MDLLKHDNLTCFEELVFKLFTKALTKKEGFETVFCKSSPMMARTIKNNCSCHHILRI